jgi:hypothetical protein
VRSWYTDAGSGINGLVPIGAEASHLGLGARSRCCPAVAGAAVPCFALPTSPAGATTTSVMASDWFPASAFRYVLCTDPLISEYQVRQTAAGADVGLVGSPDVSAVAAALAVSLARYGLSNPELSISIVEEIPRHASTGKLKRFIAPSG